MANIIGAVLRIFFYLLYHPFAWLYDLVAQTVSWGRWKAWVFSILPKIQGQILLEIGFGPGHLLEKLQSSGYQVYGIDESWQMCNLASTRLEQHSHHKGIIIRGVCQDLPFPSSQFDTVITTFPPEFIFNETSVKEIYRVLKPGQEWLLIPAAWITGTRLVDKFLATLFRITGQSPPVDMDFTPLLNFYQECGFQIKIEWIILQSSKVLCLRLHKSRINQNLINIQPEPEKLGDYT
ncbi:MAG TPA: class I SAM-dependent methyltransferase [Anaerolineaceae bacterium]